MANVTDEPVPMNVVQEQGKSRGCLYGCLFVVVGALALILCTGIAGYWFVSSTVTKYTSDSPVNLPSVEYTQEQLAVLEKRLETFNEAFEKGAAPEQDLVLTAEEINALISKEDKLKGKVFIKIEDGLVSGDVSIPTDMIPGGKGRYFNGSASLDVSMSGGVLIVTLAAAEANGEQVPAEIIDAMASENLAKELYKDPETAKRMRRFESVSVEGDTIVLKVKRDEPAAEAPAETQAQDEAPPADENTEPENTPDNDSKDDRAAADDGSADDGSADDDSADDDSADDDSGDDGSTAEPSKSDSSPDA